MDKLLIGLIETAKSGRDQLFSNGYLDPLLRQGPKVPLEASATLINVIHFYQKRQIRKTSDIATFEMQTAWYSNFYGNMLN